MGSGTFPWPDSGLETLFLPAQLLATAAFFAYTAGLKWGSSPSRVSAAPSLGTSTKPRLWVAGLGCLVLVVPVVQSTGELAARFETRDAFVNALTRSGLGGDTIGLFFTNRLPAVCALILGFGTARALSKASIERLPGKPKTITAFIGAVIFIALFANPFSSSRYVAFAAVTAVALGVVNIARPRTRIVFSSALTIGILVVYPLASWFKKVSLQSGGNSLDLKSFSGIDFDGFQMSVNAIYYVHSLGHSGGKHVLAAVGFFVPRTIWTSKPVPASFDVAAARGYEFQNLSLPLWAELYVDLGVIGMIVLMVFYGRLSRWLDVAYHRDRMSSGASIAVLIAVAQFGLIRGPLGGSFVFFGSVVTLGWLVFRPRRTYSKGESRSAPARTADYPDRTKICP